MTVMMKILFLFLVFSNTWANNQENLAKINELKRIAFGSCSDQKDAQPLWRLLKEDSPNLFIHGGDNIYADTKDPKELAAIWDNFLRQEDYQSFRTNTPVIGIWDDHDYAYNDADGKLEIKKESQELFLNFLEEPKDSPRRTQEGIYTSYIFGQGKRIVKIILLDNRYFRHLEESAPLLGERQWKWLELELENSTAAIHIIVSGISVLSPRIPLLDAWIDYPKERRRLLELMAKTKPKGLLFLTGDKHFASIFSRDGYLEFLSSGMTHNRAGWMIPFLKTFYPNSTHKLNYGLIDISWAGDIPTLQMAIRNRYGKSTYTKRVVWKDNRWSH